MSKTTRTLRCALYLLIFYFDRPVLTRSIFSRDSRLYEGNRCPLGNGLREGRCKKAIDCPGKLLEIRNEHYGGDRHNRCGFLNFDEIVCCATEMSEILRNRERAADAACERYKKTVPQLEEESDYPSGIFNGDAAEAGEFPHMAALVYPASDDEEGAIRGRKYSCGGTLVSERHVVTAAHCVSGSQGSEPVEVLLGTVNLVEPDSATMQRIPISRIIRHPEYRRTLYYYDVAILELEKSVQFTAYVQPTCLMTKPWTNRADLRFDILGWGAVEFDGMPSPELLKAGGLKFVGNDECSKKYQNYTFRFPNGFNDGVICAVDADTTKRSDTCEGDSGGPLLISSTRKFPPLAGITSFGFACGGLTAGVYTSVYKYLDWIEDQVWPKSD